MNEILTDIVNPLIPMVVGGMGTGFMWLVKGLYKARMDLDSAHFKIRCLTKRLDELHDALGSDTHK